MGQSSPKGEFRLLRKPRSRRLRLALLPVVAAIGAFLPMVGQVATASPASAATNPNYGLQVSGSLPVAYANYTETISVVSGDVSPSSPCNLGSGVTASVLVEATTFVTGSTQGALFNACGETQNIRVRAVNAGTYTYNLVDETTNSVVGSFNLTVLPGPYTATATAASGTLTTAPGTPINVNVAISNCTPTPTVANPVHVGIQSPAGSSTAISPATGYYPGCNESAQFTITDNTTGPQTFSLYDTTTGLPVGSFVLNVNVVDTTPPVLTVPADKTVEATSAGGAVVNFTAPTATDNVDGSVPVTCDHQSGDTYPLGTTTVTCTAKDSSGNVGTATFKITVQDTTGPVLSLPTDKTVEATSPSGATVNYTVSANDAVDGPTAVTCDTPSGSNFPVGTTTVTCTSTDAHNNKSTGTFKVTVVHTTAPVITNVPADQTVEATSALGATVSFTLPTATDSYGASAPVTCDHNSGDTYALGTTTVTCTASDVYGLQSTKSFKITVSDTSPPQLTLPANKVVEATGPNGATVNYTASATDTVDGATTVNCSPASGSVFPLGDNTVTCTSTDAHNNKATGTFVISVRDTTAPTLTLPADQTVQATSSSGAKVTFTAPTATDLVDGSVPVTCDHNSGDVFPVGVTTVNCIATDAHGNQAKGTFKVSVTANQPPVLSLPSNQTAEATGPDGATVTFTASATDAVDGSDPVTCLPASGSKFAIGVTTVTCSATNSLGIKATGSFTVTVRDTTPPSLNPTLPTTITLNSTVTAQPNATDSGSGVATASCGQVDTSFIGQHTVTCTATDKAGNTASQKVTYYVVYNWKGVEQPINDTGHQIGENLSVFKAGSTVPVIFQLLDANGVAQQGPSSPVWLGQVRLNSMSQPVDESVDTAAPTSGPDFAYSATPPTYQYNWKTSKADAGYWYLISWQLPDGSIQSVVVGLR